jgi:hypothetical protein
LAAGESGCVIFGGVFSGGCHGLLPLSH